MTATRLISAELISELISMPEVIEVTEEVYALHGRKSVVMPAKVNLDLAASGEPNWFNAMPAFVPTLGAAGIKWVGGFINNPPRRRLGYLQSLLILNDPITGEALAVMDGVLITALRTGASAAVATKWLGRPNSGSVTLLGAGVQGRAVANALSVLCDWIEELIVCDIIAGHAERFAKSLKGELNFRVNTATDVQGAVRSADVIITATTANEPLLFRDWLKPGALVVTLGSYQELDHGVVLGADERIVDDRVQCLHRGEFASLFNLGKLSASDLSAELGDVVVGAYLPRMNEDAIIVASLVGLGSVDIACAQRVYERALTRADVPSFSFS